MPVVIESRTLWFLLDSGASHSSLTRPGLERLPGGAERAQTTPARRVRSLGGPRLALRSVPDLTLRIGEVRFAGRELPVVRRQQPRVGLQGADAEFPVHGVLGADILLGCRLTFDSGELLLRRATD